MKAKTWLWPDRAIGKAESRQLREEHNAAVELLESYQAAAQADLRTIGEQRERIARQQDSVAHAQREEGKRYAECCQVTAALKACEEHLAITRADGSSTRLLERVRAVLAKATEGDKV